MKALVSAIILSFILLSAHAQDDDLSIVFLGDSNTAIYGERMHGHLSSLSNNANFYGLPGARPYHYLESHPNLRYFGGEYIRASGNLGRSNSTPPKMGDLIAQHKPDVFVVALGGNQMGQSMREDYTSKGWIGVKLADLRNKTNLPANMSESQRTSQISYVARVQKEIKALIDKMPAESQCIYISPPLGASTHLKPEFFHDAIKEIVTQDGRCDYIDGRAAPFVARSSSDPVHFSRSAANTLADNLFNQENGIKDLILRRRTSAAVDAASNVGASGQAPSCSTCDAY